MQQLKKQHSRNKLTKENIYVAKLPRAWERMDLRLDNPLARAVS